MTCMRLTGPASSIRFFPNKDIRSMVFKAAAVQMCSGVDPEKNAESMARPLNILFRDATDVEWMQ